MLIARLKSAAISMLVAGALAGGVFAVHALATDPELVAKNQSLSDELSRLEARNRRLQSENAALEAEILRLRGEDKASVHHARTGLGMVLPGEMVYQFPASSPPERPPGQSP